MIYYLSPTGDDTNTGSSTSPWLTLQKGYNALNDGDTLLLMDGVYHIQLENACFFHTGGSLVGGYKIIRAQNKGKAILDGDNVGKYCFETLNGSSYIKIQNLVFTRWRVYPLFDNSHLGSKWIWFQGNVVHDSGNILNDVVNELGGGGVFIGWGCSFWIITQNVFYKVGARGYDNIGLRKDHALYTQDTSPYSNNIEFSYNLCWQISGNPLDFQSSRSLVVNNTFAWNTSNLQGAGIGIVDSSSLARNNIIANNHWYQLSTTKRYIILEREDTGRWYLMGNMINGANWYYPGLSWPAWLIDPATGTAYENWGQIDSKYDEVDPKFVHAINGDYTNVDFHLLPDSPAIGKGYPIKLFSLLGAEWFIQNPNWQITNMFGVSPTPPTDLDGVVVRGTPDIGAYQYSESKALYYNTIQSEYFQKNTCTNAVGTRVLYTVPVGTYSSIVSQADANNKALADIAANGQEYANTHGSCLSNTTVGVGVAIQEYFTITSNGIWKLMGDNVFEKLN